MNSATHAPTLSSGVQSDYGLPRRATLVLTLVVLAAVALIYRATLLRMAQSWGQSDSYSHGWLILAICLYLVWRQRSSLARVPLQAGAIHLFAVAAAVLVWLAGAVANALVVQQLAIVAIVAASIAALCGGATARSLAFPLAFLVFAVPFGESLVPPLMQWTASGTIALLRITGIPVFRDGMLFSTSAGDFEVARACSGIRYLTASAAVGLLYGHLALHRRSNRVVFALLAITVPIVANAFRAYLIVVLAHLSDMRIATGVDHFIYGWVFFGIVMLGVIWIGGLMRRRERAPTEVQVAPVTRSRASVARSGAVAGAAIALIAAGPLLAQRFAFELSQPVAVSSALPQALGDWRGPLATSSAWQPSFVGEPRVIRGGYEHRELGRIVVAVVSYPIETQDSELIGEANTVADLKQWRFVSSGATHLSGGATVKATKFASFQGPRRLDVWSVYALDGRPLTSPFIVKLRGTIRRLQDPPEAPAFIAVAREHEGEVAAAHAALNDFLHRHLSALAGCAQSVRAHGEACRPPP